MCICETASHLNVHKNNITIMLINMESSSSIVVLNVMFCGDAFNDENILPAKCSESPARLCKDMFLRGQGSRVKLFSDRQTGLSAQGHLSRGIEGGESTGYSLPSPSRVRLSNH